MAQLNCEEAINLFSRIHWVGHFYEVGFYDLPLCFSDVRFKVKRISQSCSLTDFLKDWVDTNCREFKLALERLNKTLSAENIKALEKIGKKTNLSEDQTLVGIGVHLIRQLTGTAQTSWSRSQIHCPCECGVKLEHSETMYIGSEYTLHGELDIRSLVDITAAEKIPVDEDVPMLEKQSSNGRSVNVECKKTTDDKPRRHQVIAQAITYGWTQYNRHRDLSPYIPYLFIDNTKFALFMYNPKLDCLFVCQNPIMFIDDELKCSTVDRYSGIFILWIILHYRIFFRNKTVYEESEYSCRFNDQVSIQSYEELKDYSACIRGSTDILHWGPPVTPLWSKERMREDRKRKHLDSE